MAPGNLVVSAYVGCPDITLTVNPALRLPGIGRLLHVDLAAGGGRRLGGSALAQVYSQVRRHHLTTFSYYLSGQPYFAMTTGPQTLLGYCNCCLLLVAIPPPPPFRLKSHCASIGYHHLI
jgi:hypothetical protein